MSHYLLIMEQDGGCDYTIGCGIALHYFEEDSLEKAKDYAIKYMIEQYGDGESWIGDNIDKARVLEVGDFWNIEIPREDEAKSSNEADLILYKNLQEDLRRRGLL